MALTAQTQQQWYDKISKWVPTWWFQNQFGKNVTQAIFWGAAAVYQQAEQDMLDQQQSTFITESSAPVLDLLGDERDQVRTTGQLDASFAQVVQNCLFRNVGYQELLALINAQLTVQPAWLFANQQEFFFDDPDITETPGIAYFDDFYTRWLLSSKTYNWWTLIVPAQTGGNFTTIMANLVAIIEANKALGTTYDIGYDGALEFGTEDGLNIFETEDASDIFIPEN